MSKRSIVVLILLAFVAGLVTATPVAAKKSGKAWLGVYLQDINRDIKEAMDLESKRGALIAGVVEDSPAEEAGIEEEDVIVEFDGEKVRSSSSLTRLVKKHSPGDEITLKVVREGKENKIIVTLGKRPKEEFIYEYDVEPLLELKKGKSPEVHFFGFHSGGRIGVRVQDLSDQLGDYFGVEDAEGVLITEVEEDMPAEKAGLKAGDVIVEADGDQVDDTQELSEIISEKEEGDKVEIKVIRDRTPRSFNVEVEEGESWSLGGTKGLKELRVLAPEKVGAPKMMWKEKFSSEIEEEMEELREELEELKEELQELRKKLK
ncbi:MAG: PDZ domain-containing protein [Candidatus Zixiibacteriota bacterium]|nr:MAG: PDZ domain-containing protein [candidate division Zixibacteria bacterium]